MKKPFRDQKLFHLGSTSWMTYTNDSEIQHLYYLPWGEPLVDVRNPQISYNARYTFASKERDEESGLSYFGARYYSSDLSIWLSVDPMSDKYPSTSPYAYCRNNPIILVDPNGEFDTRSEARQYRKEHHTGGVIKKNDGKNPWGGNYSIENKKKGSSYTKINYQENESGHFIYGQDDEQVVCGPLISPKNNSERSSAQVLATTGLVCGTLGGDDVTGIGIADDIAIPVVAIAGVVTTVAIHLMSQHGTNNGRLSPEELNSLKAKERNGTLTTQEKNKLKRHEKNVGIRHSRKSKDN